MIKRYCNEKNSTTLLACEEKIKIEGFTANVKEIVEVDNILKLIAKKKCENLSIYINEYLKNYKFKIVDFLRNETVHREQVIIKDKEIEFTCDLILKEKDSFIGISSFILVEKI